MDAKNEAEEQKDAAQQEKVNLNAKVETACKSAESGEKNAEVFSESKKGEEKEGKTKVKAVASAEEKAEAKEEKKAEEEPVAQKEERTESESVAKNEEKAENELSAPKKEKREAESVAKNEEKAPKEQRAEESLAKIKEEAENESSATKEQKAEESSDKMEEKAENESSAPKELKAEFSAKMQEEGANESSAPKYEKTVAESVAEEKAEDLSAVKKEDKADDGSADNMEVEAEEESSAPKDEKTDAESVAEDKAEDLSAVKKEDKADDGSADNMEVEAEDESSAPKDEKTDAESVAEEKAEDLSAVKKEDKADDGSADNMEVEAEDESSAPKDEKTDAESVAEEKAEDLSAVKKENIADDGSSANNEQKTEDGSSVNLGKTTADADEDAAKSDEEFSYTQREEFTSEIYKIEVTNLGYFGIGEFKKLLKKKLNLDMCKIKSFNQKDRAYVCFRTSEDQKRAISLLNGYKWKGKTLEARVAQASADPLLKKRRKEAEACADKPAVASKPKRMRTSADATVPLASLSYEKQLEMKREKMIDLLARLQSQLLRTNPAAKDFTGAFKFLGVEPAPKINGYRNKCEFTVGKNDKDEITVGFRLSSYADGSIEVAEVDDLPHLPDAAKWAARSFQEFVRKSKFAPFSPETNKGHFRQIMVRTSELTNELMLVPGLYCSNLTEDETQQIMDELKAFYMDDADPNAPFKCTSLFYQDVQRRAVGQMVCPVNYIAGEKQLTDAILGLNYRISPLAFFQVNTKSTEVLYKKAIELAAPLPHSTMLDICCGAGTIALTFAKHCKKVLGVDIVEEAIRDAVVNAGANKIENCKFYTGNADEYIGSMAKEVVYGKAPNEELDLFAVVDPPRPGLHVKSIISLRAATAIKRLVYISCNPERALRNFVDLGRPQSKQYRGHPFFPITAVAVDMFPHTSHTELIVLFERCAPLDEPSEDEQNTKTAHKFEASTSQKPAAAKTDESKTVDPKAEDQTSAASTEDATPMDVDATVTSNDTETPMKTETTDDAADPNPKSNGTNGTEQPKTEKPE